MISFITDHATGLAMGVFLTIAIVLGIKLYRKRRNLGWFYKH